MLISLVNFFYLVASSFLIGFFVCGAINKMRTMTIDIYIVSGLVFLTVFAQIYSLFSGINYIANLIVLLLCCILVITYKNKIVEFLKGVCKNNFIDLSLLPLLIIVIVFFMIIASNTPNSPDDYLYHNQAMRWIEKYGIVKGLGNAHARFAYNSAFLPLAALFSWHDLPFINQSLHGVNACVCCMLVLYCICTFNVQKKVVGKGSNILKLTCILYIIYECNNYSGLSTDAMAIAAVFYIFIKWIEYIDDDGNEISFLVFICLLSVYAFTLKLSMGFTIMLAIYPFCKCVYEKRFKEIAMLIVFSLVILLPFLLRNVIISGYVVYPIKSIDLFDVDWKIPEWVIDSDIYGMVVFGRSLESFLNIYSYEQLAHMPFLELSFGAQKQQMYIEGMGDPPKTLHGWFPQWFKGQLNLFYKLVFILNIICIIMYIIGVIIKIVKKEKFSIKDFTIFTLLICVILWLFSAPLIRYGGAYLCILLVTFIGLYVGNEARIVFSRIILAILCFKFLTLLSMPYQDVGLVYPADYIRYPMRVYKIVSDDNDSVDVYLPVKSASCQDYWTFPGLPYDYMLEHIGMYSCDYKDGFYAK